MKTQNSESAGLVLYLAPDGRDETGDGSEEKPFRRLEEARDAIRAMEKLPEGGVTVYFRAGEYNLKETFILTPEDSGKEEKPIVWSAYPGEEVRIVSKELITGWRELTEEEKTASLFGMSDEAKGEVRVAEIPTGWRFHDLYENGAKLRNSRMTESDRWQDDWLRVRSTPDLFGPEGLRGSFDAGVLDGLDGWEDAEIRILTAIWWNVNAVLTKIDSNNQAAYIRSGLSVFYPEWMENGREYNLMNTPKYLTRGEWCVDSVRGKVYYWPENGVDPNESVIFAPKLRELVRFQGDEEKDGWKRQVRHVSLRNLQFLFTDRVPETELDPLWLTRNGENPDGMIYMQGVDSCSVEDCVLGYSGSQGIVIDHWAQNCSVTGCEIAHSSSGGIFITGYGPGAVDVNHHHTIERCHIHHVGEDYMHSCAVQIFGSGYDTIEYNYFHDLPYAAVSIIGMIWTEIHGGQDAVVNMNTFGGKQTLYNARWNEIDRASVRDHLAALPYLHSGRTVIQYNICDNYMQILRDGGALYAFSSGRDKVWRYNCGYREHTDDWGVRAIHIDDWDVFNDICGNLFHAHDVADNSHTHDREIPVDPWDDTLGDNVYRRNIASEDAIPDGYLALRAKIRKRAGRWLGVLPGGNTVVEDDLIMPLEE